MAHNLIVSHIFCYLMQTFSSEDGEWEGGTGRGDGRDIN